MINKPANISNKIWASLGDVEAPTDAKMETGWVAEVPKAQVENWVQNRQDAFNAHVNERGIAEWDATTDYIANKSYVQGSDGLVYQCLISSGPTTTPKDPIGNTTNGYWAQAFVTGTQGTQLANRISAVESDLADKQDVLVSGSNIKTINGQSILGSGNLEVGDDVTGANVGTGVGVFKEKFDSELRFKRLRAEGEISVIEVGDDIVFQVASAGADIQIFPAVADIPPPVDFPVPSIAYVSSTKELLYSDGSVWNILAVSGTYAGSGSDPYFSNVSLLLYMTGPDGSTTFTDSSSIGNTVTATGAVISHNQSKFGDGSGFFNGTNASLSIPHSANVALATSDFTVETWIFLPTTVSASQVLMVHRPVQTATGVNIFIQNMIPQAFFGDASATAWEVMLTSSTAISPGTWSHFAVTREGSIFRMFLNGTQVATATVSVNINDSGGNLLIGRSEPGSFLNGYLNDFRLTKGVARYTTTFTPPSSPFPNA